MASTNAIRVTPRDVVRILFRHQRKIATVFAGILAVTLLLIIVWPRSYSSEARLFIRVGRESVALDPTATTGQTIMLQKTQADEVNSALEILGSSEVLGRVVDKVGADRILGYSKPSGESSGRMATVFSGMKSSVGSALAALRLSEPGTDRDLALRRLKDEIGIWAPKKSTVIGISYQADTPELARDIVAATTEAFLETHLRLNHTSGSLGFFSEQVELLGRDLSAAETELRDRKNEYGLASSDSKRQILEGQISSVELELLRTERQLRFSEAKVADLTEQIDGLAPQLVTNRVAGFANEAKDNMREKLYELELQESQLQSRYTAQHPLLIQIHEQRQRAEDILQSLPDDRTQTTESLNPNQRALELELMREKADADALQARRDAAAAQHATLYEQFQSLNEQELELVQLERKVQLLDRKYRTHVEKLEEARVNDALEREQISNINVVQPATLVLKPAEPQKRLIMAIGLLLAGCGGLGIAFLTEALDQTCRTPEQIEAQLGLPVLLTLAARSNHRERRSGATQEPSSTFHVTDGNRASQPGGNGRTVSGDYQALAAQLHPQGNRGVAPVKVVGVVDCQAGKYGSEVAADVAIQAAQLSSTQVLLIDADAENRRVATRFGLNGSPGFCELLAGEGDPAACIHRPGNDNLAVMTAGENNEALRTNGDASGGLKQVDLLKQQYGLIVVDLPCHAVAAWAAGWVDEAILVVEAETTRVGAVQRVRRQLERLGVPVSGVVLKNQHEHLPKWLDCRL